VTPAPFSLVAIGTVRGGRRDAVDDHWGEVRATIELDPDVVEPSSTVGLDAFSHVEVIYVFDRADPDATCRGSRRPRGRPEWPEVGILAQRAKDRPNHLGVTRCRLVGVDGLRVDVAGLDAIDGTPVVDLKPHFAEFDPRGEVREPDWAVELMADYW
jgi:tRNA (adenine37-N6)-methyltransferase